MKTFIALCAVLGAATSGCGEVDACRTLVGRLADQGDLDRSAVDRWLTTKLGAPVAAGAGRRRACATIAADPSAVADFLAAASSDLAAR